MCLTFFQRLFKKKQTPAPPEPVKATEVVEPMRIIPYPTPPKSVRAISETKVGTYPSIAAAAKATGINRGSIHACLAGKRRTAGGFKWEYYKPGSDAGDGRGA